MILFPLIRKMAELFIIILATAGLVKAGLLKSEDSRSLSRFCLYVVSPCVIFLSFQQDLTPEITRGLLAAVLLALFFNILFILIAQGLKHLWHANEVERASIIFTNAGNLIIPIVSFTLGEEWVIYVSAYIAVFNVICWTYGVSLFDRESAVNPRKILLNPNVLAILFGLLSLFTGFRLPGVLNIAVTDVAAMIGPISMMTIGAVLGGMKLQNLFSNRRIFGVIAFRMLLCSGLAVAFALLSGVSSRIPAGHQVVMISLLSAIAPSASNINNLAILYNHDAEYATSINILTTLSCIVTIPLWIYVYELFA